jgi:ABC-type xylose transport system substrate-binding protein
MNRIIVIFIFACFSFLNYAQDSLKIGFSLGDFSVDRWVTDRNYFTQEANALGASVLSKNVKG